MGEASIHRTNTRYKPMIQFFSRLSGDPTAQSSSNYVHIVGRVWSVLHLKICSLVSAGTQVPLYNHGWLVHSLYFLLHCTVRAKKRNWKKNGPQKKKKKKKKK